MFLSVQEAAEKLNLKSTRTIYNYFKSGKLTKYKQNNKTLVSRQEIDRLSTPIPVSEIAGQEEASQADDCN